MPKKKKDTRKREDFAQTMHRVLESTAERSERQSIEELAAEAGGPVQPILDSDGKVIEYRSVFDDDESLPEAHNPSGD